MVGPSDGARDGTLEIVGSVVGAREGRRDLVGKRLGLSVGESVGFNVGSIEGEEVGASEGQELHFTGHVSASSIGHSVIVRSEHIISSSLYENVAVESAQEEQGPHVTGQCDVAISRLHLFLLTPTHAQDTSLKPI